MRSKKTTLLATIVLMILSGFTASNLTLRDQKECKGCYYNNVFYSKNSLLCMPSGNGQGDMHKCVYYKDNKDYGWKYHRAGCR